MKSRKAIRTAVALLCAVLLAVAMNGAAFLLPEGNMREHAEQGLAMLAQEGSSPELVGGYRSAQLDNFTAALMIKTAAYTGDDPFMQKALGGLRIDVPPEPGSDMWGDWAAFCQYTTSEESGISALSYTRYWHGYILPLRLLLTITNVANVQMLLYYLQTALFMLVSILCARRAISALPGFLCAFFLMMPAATGTCFQYMPMTLLALGACLMLLLNDEAIDRAIGMPGFFALLGLAANYFDLLTFPLVALGFPLALRMAMRIESGKAPAKALFAELFFCGLCWGLGYAGMWALKWLLTALCFGAGRLTGVFEQITLRLSSASNGASYARTDALLRNLDVILQKPAYLMILLLTAAVICAQLLSRLIKARRSGKAIALRPQALLLVLLAAVPVCWCLVMANHSHDHFYFTYRNLTVSFLALFICAAQLIGPVSSKETP